MASTAARAELADQVEDAVVQGRKGPSRRRSCRTGRGAYYPATVLSGVTPEMRAYHEELFGPVAVLYRVDSVDEAIELANDSPYGLGSAVFTGDQEQAAYVARPTRRRHGRESTPPSRAPPTCRSAE